MNRKNRIAGLVVLTLFFGLSVGIRAERYDKLWQKAEKLLQEGRPKSAGEVLEDIRSQAVGAGDRGQELAAFLAASGCRQTLTPDSLFPDIILLRRRVEGAKDVAERAVCASSLARILSACRWRGVSTVSDWQAPTDSVHLWSREQFEEEARHWYLVSMTAPDTLAERQASEYFPIIEPGTDRELYAGDLLNLMVRRAVEGLVGLGQRDEAIACLHQALKVYRNRGNRQAQLLLGLDSLRLVGQEAVVPYAVHETRSDSSLRQTDVFRGYERLMQAFADLPEVTMAYVDLCRLDWSAAERVRLAEAGIALHPQSVGAGLLRRMLAEWRLPMFEWQVAQVTTPFAAVEWRATLRNLSELAVEVYRLNEKFDQTSYERSKDPQAYVRKQGRRVAAWTHRFVSHPDYESFRDTVCWQPEEWGQYAVIFRPVTGAKGVRVVETSGLFRVSGIGLFALQADRGNRTGFQVVDLETGGPLSEALVELRVYGRRGEFLRELTEQTDRQGWLETTLRADERAEVSAVFEGDSTAGGWTVWGTRGAVPVSEGRSKSVRLFTDRGIYRPGQTVRVGGIAYGLYADSSRVSVDEPIVLCLFDAQGRELERRDLRTDAFGTFDAVFRLPVSGLNGIYRIEAEGRSSAWFRVEEYVRPTFSVTVDDGKDQIWSFGDTLAVTGRAAYFAGTPVRGARVIGRWHLVTYGRPYPIKSYPMWAQELPSGSDTVLTDADGRFLFRVSVTGDSVLADYGCRLQFDAEVLSAAGETRMGNRSFAVSRQPLHFRIDGEALQERDALRPFQFRLESLSGQTVPATVFFRLLALNDEGRPVRTLLEGKTPANSSCPIDALADCPSGRLRLQAWTEVEGRQLADSLQLTLFSLADTRPVVDTAFWFYQPCDTFGLGRPARLQLGTSLKQATCYYAVSGPDGWSERGQLMLSDSVVVLEWPYQEQYADGMNVSVILMRQGQIYRREARFFRDRPDDRLKWKWTVFRDRLRPGEQEEWQLTLQHPDGTPARARVLAALYDASLDALADNGWHFYMNRPTNRFSVWWHANEPVSNWGVCPFQLPQRNVRSLSFDRFNPKFFQGWGGSHTVVENMILTDDELAYSGSRSVKTALPMMKAASDRMTTAGATENGVVFESAEVEIATSISETEKTAITPEPYEGLRTNFNETAFFYPRLQTDSAGCVSLVFTLPESLTTWNFKALAYTLELAYALIGEKIIAQKEFMARLQLPRFVRRGDEAVLTAVLEQLTDRPVKGWVRLEIFDPQTEQVIRRYRKRFALDAQADTVLHFAFPVKASQDLLACRLVAEGKDFSDGEQHYLPVLPDEVVLTESRAWAVDGPVFSGQSGHSKSESEEAESATQTTVDLTGLFAEHAQPAGRRLTIEYQSSPIWAVWRTLPALAEPTSERVNSLAAAYYASALAAALPHRWPEFYQILSAANRAQSLSSADQVPATTDDNLSVSRSDFETELERNAALKALLLQETPWLLEARNDREQLHRIFDLLDANVQTGHRVALLQRLVDEQRADGSFGWYPGMSGQIYTTTSVVRTFVRLQQLGAAATDASLKQQEQQLVSRAMTWLDQQVADQVERKRKLALSGGTPVLSHTDLDYLYLVQHSDQKQPAVRKHNADYLLRLLSEQWTSLDKSGLAQAAMILAKAGRNQEASACMLSLEEHLVQTPSGWCFDVPSRRSAADMDRRLATQVQVMEAFRTLRPEQQTLQQGMSRWLLAQKRIQGWEQPEFSVEAVYALLASGVEGSSVDSDCLTLSFARGKEQTIQSQQAPLVGMLHWTASGASLPSEPVRLTVERNRPGTGWGAVYATYRLPLAFVERREQGLSLRLESDDQSSSAEGRTLQVGDKQTFRYVLRADQDYEYVHLRLGRAACCEPVDASSGYRYRFGLSYYQAVHDASIDIFIERLPKGSYVFEIPYYIIRSGSYQQGVSEVQCLYAPEYRAFTSGAVLNVK